MKWFVGLIVAAFLYSWIVDGLLPWWKHKSRKSVFRKGSK